MKKITLIGTVIILIAAMAVLVGADLNFAKDDYVKVDDSGQKAWLGIFMQDLNKDIAEALDLKVDKGVLINDVIDDSPAKKAGLKDGDIIILMDKNVIDNTGDLSKAIKSYKPGDAVNFVVIRDGNKQDYRVVLGENQKVKDYKFSLKDNKDKIKKYYQQFKIDSKSTYLGVMLEDLSDQLAEYFGVEDGVLITEVLEDSPAEAAGLKAGDVIVSIGGKPVESSSEATEYIRKYEKGDKADIEVVRRGEKKVFAAELDEKAMDASWYGLMSPKGPNVMFLPNLDDQKFNFDFQFDENMLDNLQNLNGDLHKELQELRDELNDLRNELNDLRNERK